MQNELEVEPEVHISSGSACRVTHSHIKYYKMCSFAFLVTDGATVPTACKMSLCKALKHCNKAWHLTKYSTKYQLCTKSEWKMSRSFSWRSSSKSERPVWPPSLTLQCNKYAISQSEKFHNSFLNYLNSYTETGKCTAIYTGVSWVTFNRHRTGSFAQVEAGSESALYDAGISHLACLDNICSHKSSSVWIFGSQISAYYLSHNVCVYVAESHRKVLCWLRKASTDQNEQKSVANICQEAMQNWARKLERRKV